MGQMASTLAHELNQPLTAVTSYLNGLRRLAEGPFEAQRLTEVIDRTVAQAARAGEVIRRLRAFVAKGDTDRRLENVNELVEEAVGLALIGARQAGVGVSLLLDPATRMAFIDRVQVQQVMLNLIRNAVEAMEATEQRHLTVTTRPLTTDGGAEIQVIDTGPGLSPEVAERLFQPFTTTKESGMGVGLSICREIVEAHHGRITYGANEPTGAIFTVTLPAPDADEVENPIPA
jgi:two-component system sensor kinase FixL